jgi:uncharacterized protein with HEPN domain
MAPRDLRAPLLDILAATEIIRRAVTDKTLTEYRADVFLRSIVERQFITIGEALTRVRRLDPGALDGVPDAAAIIAFRNILVHGYDAIDDEIVWIAATDRLPKLIGAVEAIFPVGADGRP